MLVELRIENFAIIDHLELTFHAGLNIFTGETGAGKSIIIDAVETILGSRAEASMVRAGAERAQIEATFQLSAEAEKPVHEILQREDLLEDAPLLTLGREIRSSGRSVARVNGRSVNIGVLSELGEYLVDVHGQSEHLSLLRVARHLGLLDIYANVETELGAYQQAYRRLLDVRRELDELRKAESDAARQQDVLQYQIREIETAHLKAGEEEELSEERNRLANAEGLSALAQEAILLLDEGTPESPAAIDLFGEAVSGLANLARLDPQQTALLEQANVLFENLSDLSGSLRSYLEGIEFNPRRLDQVEERLNLIHNLKRKYGEDTAAVLAFAEQARRQLEAITHAGERIAELEADESLLLTELAKTGQALSKKRHAASKVLAQAVEVELDSLSMSGARFAVDFQTRLDEHGVLLEDGQRVAFDVHGLERVEFLVAPNPGEGLKPLVKIASGGETSRLMLAIKDVLARADQVPTLIFDEIDQGIGGRVGGVVGHKLWNLARQHQVLCVTHLPQLAAYGEQHLHVRKEVQDARTITRVETLQGQERITELAQMMGEVSQGTLQSAREILGAAQTR